MHSPASSRFKRSHGPVPTRSSGAALIIILAFVVLLTGLIVAFFSRAMSERQVSNSSANQAKVELFAQGAMDTIVSDLKQEIAAGSMSITGSIGSAVFIPTSPVTAVPALSGTVSGTSFPPNLLKRSAYNQPFYSGSSYYNLASNTVTTTGSSTTSYTAPNRAVNASTSGTSQNGRFISPARWNKSLLLPKKTVTSSTDFTPVDTGTNAFIAPDWILVARNGSNPPVWNSSLTTSGSNPVTGRFAYMVYDEGGGLDMNVAGCPSGLTSSQLGGKGALALADLTALTDSSGVPLINQTQIDALVGWRNYATTQVTGTFPNPGFTAVSGSNYYNYVSNNTTGFLTISGTALNNNQSDRIFTSRQQLIKFLAATGTLGGNTLAATQNALQYLGTFSRDLEQPSFVPDPNLSNVVMASDAKAHRPKNKWLVDTDNSNDVCGSAASNDTSGAKQDLINPSLLTVQDSTGQPVMKRRFPLSRLSLLETASNTVRVGGSIGSTSDPTSLASKIYDYFGLTWGAPSASTVIPGGLTSNGWTYSHGDPTRIYKLSEIPPSTTPASANPDGTAREPDFFETLKAVINCDSLGKQQGNLQVGTAAHSGVGPLVDGQIHNQLIQMGANLIDQYDADSYPTCIFFNNLTFYGIENLPYFSGWQQMWYRMKALTAGTDYDNNITYIRSGTTVSSSGTSYSYTISSTPPNVTDGSGNTPGGTGTVYETSVMIQPIIWNPHTPDSNPTPTGVPTSFRITVSDPTNVSVLSPFHPYAQRGWWITTVAQSYYLPAASSYATANSMVLSQTKNEYIQSGGTYAPYADKFYSFPQPVLNPNSSFITFNTGASPADFREPYRLRAPNYPAGSNATATSSDPNNPAQITIGADPNLIAADGGSSTAIGINCGKCWTGPSIDKTNDQKWLSVGAINHDMKLILQYQQGGNWYTYDVIQDVYNASGNISTVDNTDIPPYRRFFRACLRADPRTDRWGEFHMAVWPSTNAADVPAGSVAAGLPGDNGVDGAYGNNAAPHFYLPQGITWKPSLNSTYYATGGALGLAASQGWASNLEAPSDLMVNVPSRAPWLNPNALNPNVGAANTGAATTPANQLPPGAKFCYADPDAVLRRSSGWNFSAAGDGLPLYTANGNYNSRPVILNRPFQSIAEMGYVFRDVAWKELDFFSPESGDAALLDAFCLNELQNTSTDMTVAGRVNLNTRQPKVLQALIQGVSKAEGGIITNTEAQNAAQALVNWTTDITSGTTSAGGAKILYKGPLRNRSELVGKFVYQIPFSPAYAFAGAANPTLDGSKSYQGFSSMLTSGTSPVVFGSLGTSADASIKRRCESVMRALVDSGNTRTWNLMIDVISQVGRYPANASGLDKFVVEGETRYWVHLAIDRLTGKVVAKVVEPVTE